MSLQPHPVRWSEVTALFGGTFDPPHRGHLEAVRGLLERPGVSAVRVLPAATPPHKSGITSTEDRVAMARILFDELRSERVALDLREIERARRTGGPTYSIDTIREVAAEGSTQVAFVVGADQLRDLHRWHRFPELLGACHWIVLARKPAGDATARETLAEWAASGLARPDGSGNGWWLSAPGGRPMALTLQPTEAPPLSSTSIREAIGRTGRPPADSLTDKLVGYLKEHHLYGS